MLSARRHGESSVILSLLTGGHGRHAGLVRGGASRRQRGILQPGNLVGATWRARLEDHLGNPAAATSAPTAAGDLDDPARLAALKAQLAAARGTAPLFDTARFARTLTAALRAIWQRHCANAAPAPLDIGEVP